MNSLAMKISTCTLRLLICNLLWLVTAQDVSAAPSANIVYENPERTLRTSITENIWAVGPIFATTPLPSQVGLFIDTVGLPVVDCSDSIYRCVQSWSRTIAIPRAGLKPGLKYQKDGVLFDVETCLRGDAERCQVALVSAKCEARVGDGPCSHFRPSRKEHPVRFEYILYFFYNEDVGVTAMGVTDRVASTLSAKRAVATQSVLVGTHGLLGK